MKILMVLVLMVNHEMELITESYPTHESCVQQTEIIRKDVDSINNNLYPIEIVSLTCVPEIKELNDETAITR